MKLLFGALGAVLMIAFLASFALKVRETSMMIVVAIGIVMMLVDAWQARYEADT